MIVSSERTHGSSLKSTVVAGALLPVDVHAVSIPAGRFTGDLYFVHRRFDGVWFVLGDVAGKGLDAAIFMKMVHEELEERVVSEELSVSCLVRCVHEALSPEFPSNRFLSLVAGHLAPNGRLTLINAGHTPPMLVRRGGEIEVIDSTGPVVGILPLAGWSERELHLGSGEAVVVYSDGVTEARSASGEELGIGGLVALLQCLSVESSRRVVDQVRSGVDAFRAGHPADDDTTIMTLMRK
jgi:phosphoserine phosphatase RsbU/P